MQKIKDFVASEKGKNILTAIIIILVGFASYGAGRLSKSSEKAGIKIEYPEALVSMVPNGGAAGEPLLAGSVKGVQAVTKPVTSPQSNIKTYFASNRGSKYYHLGCDGGKTLKEENKIYFSTAAEAEAAGYELSSSCR